MPAWIRMVPAGIDCLRPAARIQSMSLSLRVPRKHRAFLMVSSRLHACKGAEAPSALWRRPHSDAIGLPNMSHLIHRPNLGINLQTGSNGSQRVRLSPLERKTADPGDHGFFCRREVKQFSDNVGTIAIGLLA